MSMLGVSTFTCGCTKDPDPAEAVLGSWKVSIVHFRISETDYPFRFNIISEQLKIIFKDGGDLDYYQGATLRTGSWEFTPAENIISIQLSSGELQLTDVSTENGNLMVKVSSFQAADAANMALMTFANQNTPSTDPVWRDALANNSTIEIFYEFERN